MGRDLFRRETVIIPLCLSVLCVSLLCGPTVDAESNIPDIRPLALRPGHPGRGSGVEPTEAAGSAWVPGTAPVYVSAVPPPLEAPPAGMAPADATGPAAVVHSRSAGALLEMRVPDDPAVRQWRERILERDRRGLQDALDRGRSYRRFISAQLAARGLPQELIYLPILESHYRVRAVSRSGATGAWQIMDNTASPLGLVRDRWVDERRDFWKSTEGALKKLEENFALFGDWDLALAAYNCGTGTLSRTVRASGVQDFWTLRDRGLLPPETAAYVPKFYALVAICTDPTAHGLEVDWELAPTWQRIPLERSVELVLLAEKAGLPLPLMEEANAELQTPITPPAGGRTYFLKIPVEYARSVEELMEDPRAELLRFSYHRIRSGDTYYALAEYYDLSAALLMEANPGTEARRMRIGEQLRIPLFSGRPVKTEPILSLSEAEASSFTGVYTVAAGDTLWGISRIHGTTAEFLAWANDRSLDAPLKPGETLKVPPVTQGRAEEGETR